MSCDVAPGASAFPVASRGLECVFHVAQSTTRLELEQDCSERAAVFRCCIVMFPAASSCSNLAEPSPSHTKSFLRRSWSVTDGCGGERECGSFMLLQRPWPGHSSKVWNPEWWSRRRQSLCHHWDHALVWDAFKTLPRNWPRCTNGDVAFCRFGMNGSTARIFRYRTRIPVLRAGYPCRSSQFNQSVCSRYWRLKQ